MNAKITRKALTSIVCALAAAAAAGTAGAAPKDGTYNEKVMGLIAPFTVSVTLQNGRIEKVEVPDALESPGVGEEAIGILAKRIVDAQSAGVDGVSGATMTSFAMLQGVRKALKEAGADESFFKKVTVQSALPDEMKSNVVIIGGGGAGLAAAVSALENGATVTIVEKLGYLGGSTNVCGGAFNASGTKYQKALGIEDNPQKHFEQTMKGGHDTNNPELVHYLADHATETLGWLEGMGLVVNPKVGAATGALYQRSHYPDPAGGHTYVATLEKALEKYGDRVHVLLETKALNLIEENGRVVGVEAQNHGKTVKVYGDKGVIVATGGFGANIEFRQKVNTGIWKEAKLDKEIGCSNISAAAQGDGLIMAEKVNANLIGLADIQVHPNGTPGTGLMLDIKTSGRNRLFINKNGDRFVDEGAPRDVLSKAVFAQPGQTYWLLQNHLRYPDENKIDLLSGRKMKDMLEQGRVQKAETLEEAAKMMGVDYNHLKAAVDEYNQVASHKVETDRFGFKANHTDDRPMTEGPWYFASKVPTIHHTMGGIQINTDAEVLDKNGKVIPGLYAAGEVTGGIHGENRLGGNAVADCMAFGCTAGRNAAKAQ